MAFKTKEQLLEELPLLIRSGNGSNGTKTTAQDLRAFLTDVVESMGQADSSNPDEINAPVGQDYFYHVLTTKKYVESTHAIRNVAGFAYQLQSGPRIYPSRTSIVDVNLDIDALSATEISEGYTLGVRLFRLDAAKASFSTILLRTA
jgi:hypothetical protein